MPHTLGAGWEVGPGPGGDRRDLYHARAFALERAPEGSPPPDSPVRALVPGDYVGGGLLLDIDLTDPRTATLGLARDRLRIPFAIDLDTDTLGTMYFDVGVDGLAVPRSEPAPEFIEDNTPFALPSLALGRERISAFETVYPARLAPMSQFGGCPSWEQGPHFPPCPTCGIAMVFIAQVDLGEAGWTGLLHAHLCARCETCAVSYECD